MQMKYSLHVLVMGMLFSLHSFSQINYANSGLFETTCNTFNAGGGPYVVGGYTHWPVAGGVLYKKTDNAITLKSQAGTTNATSMGTGYAIEYPFKEGYSYTINVTAWQQDDASKGAVLLDLSLRKTLPDATDTDPAACGAVDKNHWGTLLSNLGLMSLTTNHSTQKVVDNQVPNDNYKYLTVLAHEGASAGSTAFISKIVITETAPSFTLSPASVLKICGRDISQTFSVTDVKNIGKVNSYTWDLQADNNGWLFNGAAAPRLITTTEPSITLTSDGCGMPTSVTALANRSNGSIPTNTSVVSFGNSAVISGSTNFCGGSTTYSIANLPCGANVTWSLSPGADATLSSTTGASITLTSSTQPKSMTLNASITGACGDVTASKGINVVTKPEDPYVEGDPACMDGKIVQQSQFWASAEYADSYNWSYRSSTGLHPLPYHTADIASKFSTGTYTIYASAVNACGESGQGSYDFFIHTCNLAVAAENENASIAVSPNPASNVVVITANTTTSALKTIAKQDIREVRILDKTGRLLRKQSFPAGTNRATISVQEFKPDIYMLQIGDGKTFKTHKIKISR